MFDEILSSAGYEPVALHHDAKHWQWWVAEYKSPTRTSVEDFIYFDKRARWRDVDAAGAYLKFGHGDVDLTVLVANGAYALVRDLGKLKQKLGIDAVKSVPDFLRSAVAGRLGSLAHTFAGEEDYFVQPQVCYPSDEQKEPGVERSLRWLREFEAGKPSVGVILAHGGTGKSALARAIFLAIARADGGFAIPLLVHREQWLGLVTRPGVTLSEVWKEALAEWYPATVFGPDQLEVFLSQGAVYPIFDGFDELCTILPDVTPTDVLEEMQSLFSEGRILLTSRRRFWDENVPPVLQKNVVEIDLFPFNSAQREAYLKKRYRHAPEKQRVARQILDRISTKTLARSAAPGADTGPEFERLDYLPLVVMLVAESADVDESELQTRFGGLIEDDDPLRAVLTAFCNREKERQKLSLPGSDQLAVLEILATEFGGEFGDGDVELALEFVRDGINAAERRRFLEHTLLRREQATTFFRFPFVEAYLTASVIVRHLSDARPEAMFVKGLEGCASGLGTILDLTADLMYSSASRVDPGVEIARLMGSARLDSKAKTGLVHLALRLAKRLARGPRKDSTRQFAGIVGGAGAPDDELRDLPLGGTFSQLDLCGVRLIRCEIRDAEWIDCAFDAETEFIGCSFPGKVSFEDCVGIDLATFDPTCTWSPAAASAIQAARSDTVTANITSAQIEDAILYVVRRFRRGLGFRTRQREGVRGTVGKLFPFGSLLLDQLEQSGVIETAGSRNHIYRIADTRVAHNLVENQLFIGVLKRARDSLVSKLDVVG